MDPDGERLQLARERYSANNIEYIQGSFEEIPGDDYDIIFSNHAIHYCPDKNALFKQFEAKIKKGGKLGYIACLDDEAKRINSLPELYGEKFRDISKNWYHCSTSRDDFKQLTTANSFKIDHSEILLVKFHYKNVMDLVDSHKTHVRGEFGDSEFNIDAMRSHYGDDLFCIDYDYILVTSTHAG